MVKTKRFGASRKKREKSAPTPIGESIYSLLERMGGRRERGGLAFVWQNWAKVVGQEIAELGTPMGHKGSTLLIAAEDSIRMQELSMLTEEILDKINGQLATIYFNKIKIVLASAESNKKRLK